MSTELERARYSDYVEQLSRLAANGYEAAYIYLRCMAYVNRIIDDLYDGDHAKVSKSDIERVFSILILELPCNPFYMQNYQVLTHMHMVVYNSWLDANVMESSSEKRERIHAHVTKEYILELWTTVAKLTGGISLMREVSLKARQAVAEDMEEN